MALIDVHAHYGMNDYESYDPSTKVKIILNGMNQETNDFAVSQASINSNVNAAVGFHPLQVESEHSLVDAANVCKHIKKYKGIVAIGEIGLDYFHCKDPKIQHLQQTVFRMMLELAEKLQLPILIHARNAVSDVLDILETMKSDKTFTQYVVMHCMEASVKNIERALNMGCYFTIPAAVVRNEQFFRLVQTVPVSKMFTETDAPFQGPVKGTPAKPEDVQYAVDVIAKEKGTDPKEVENILYANYMKVF